jgi:hypothetical protein
VASDWQGAASSAFDGLYQQWNTSAANLREAPDGISKPLANAECGILGLCLIMRTPVPRSPGWSTRRP